MRAEVCLLLGNHDNREIARAQLPNLADDGNGFVQFKLSYGDVHCIGLDTLEPGKHSGFLCQQRLAWLDQALSEVPTESPVLLFQHHPPFTVGLAEMDPIALRNPDEEWEVLAGRRYPTYMFFGHVHRPVAGHWRGIPFHAQRGTNHQVAFRLRPEELAKPHRMDDQFEDPDYAFVHVIDEQVTILTRNYTFGTPVESDRD